MKQTKRILSVVLCLLMLVAVVPVMNVGMTASAASYNASAAVAFAKSHAQYDIDHYNAGPKKYGAGYCSNGWLCAGFVSACLGQGGVSIPNYSYYNSSQQSYNNIGGTLGNYTNPFSCSEAQLVYFSECGYQIISDPSNSQIDIGDVVFLYGTNRNTNGRDDHVGICVEKDANGKVYYAAHNSCTASSALSSSYPCTYVIKMNGTTYTEPPVAPTNVKCDKEYYRADESIHFTWDAVENATEYWVYMWKDGSQIYATSVGNSTSHGASPMSAGHYTLIVRAGNPVGFSNGPASVSFTIFDSAPGNPSNIKSDQPLYSTDESIHFTWDAVENATEYWVYMWKDGSQIYATSVGNSTSHGASPMSAGHYTLIVRAGNPVGFSNGPASVSFDIYDSSPQKAVVNLNKTTLTLNEEGILTWTKSANTEYYWISCWRESEQVISEQGSGFSKTVRFDRTGNYAITVVSCNKKGETFGEWIHFSVVDNTHTHSYTSFTTQAATCSATGIKTYTCSCGDSYTETIPVNSSNHVNTTNKNAVASTCTVKGYTAGVYCNDCKKYISGHAEQPLAAHKTTTQNAKAATCTAEGYTGDQVCTVCKQTITKGTAIAKKAHTLTTVNQKNASCTTAGYTGDQYCTTCKQTITKGSTVNALGHTSPDSNGNCTRCGTHIKDVAPAQPSNPQPNPNACKYCGQVHSGPFGWLIKFFHSILAIFKR